MRGAGIPSQRQLALKANLRPATITRWVQGETKSIRPNDIDAVARTLKVSPDWLLTGNGQMILIEAKHQPEGAAENVIPYQAPAPALDQALMESAMLAVLKLLEARKLKLSPEKTVAGIIAVYEAARAQGRGEVTDADVTPLVRLLMA